MKRRIKRIRVETMSVGELLRIFTTNSIHISVKYNG